MTDLLSLDEIERLTQEYGEGCYQRILNRREAIRGRFRVPAAKILAEVRLERMEHFLDLLLEESSGFL